MSSEISRVQRDAEDYLFDPDDWTPELALAVEESLDPGADHWPVLRFVRDYHEEHRITPDVRHAAGYLAEESGLDKKQGKARIFELFPDGYVTQTC